MSVVAENLVWGMGKKTIVDGVSLEVVEGETVGLIGPNGSGKSSLIRLLAGLRRPRRGRVVIGGRDVSQISRRVLARQVALVQQNTSTEMNVSVLDVVRLGRTPHRSALSGWSAADEAAVATALARVGMESRKHQSWPTLSGGERQRVHIARALAQQPAILFLDEPTNHLDIEHQIAILRMIRDLKLTSLVALHDLNHAAMFCDRIVVMQDGGVVAAGPAETVLTEGMLKAVFRVEGRVGRSPYHQRPHIDFLVD